MYVSLHRQDQGQFYPGGQCGDIDRVGGFHNPAARGTNLNVGFTSKVSQKVAERPTAADANRTEAKRVARANTSASPNTSPSPSPSANASPSPSASASAAPKTSPRPSPEVSSDPLSDELLELGAPPPAPPLERKASSDPPPAIGEDPLVTANRRERQSAREAREARARAEPKGGVSNAEGKGKRKRGRRVVWSEDVVEPKRGRPIPRSQANNAPSVPDEQGTKGKKPFPTMEEEKAACANVLDPDWIKKPNKVCC